MALESRGNFAGGRGKNEVYRQELRDCCVLFWQYLMPPVRLLFIPVISLCYM